MARRLMGIVALAGVAAVATGCASSGLSHREAGMNTQANYLAALYADGVASTQPAATRRPFSGPAALAVAQIGEVAPPAPMLDRLRKETQLFARVESIPAVGGNAYPSYRYGGASVSATEMMRSQVDTLRGLARAAGADYLLLVGGTADSTRGATPLSVLNLTIVGLFIVPSERLEAEMKASGALLDVQSGQLVTLASSELKRQTLAPAASANNDGLRQLKRMRDDVTADLAGRVADACRADAVATTARR